MFTNFQVNYFPYLGRMRGVKSVLRELSFQSKQMGRRENKTINMEGRVQFDLLQVSSDYNKLHSFTLMCFFYDILSLKMFVGKHKNSTSKS